MTAAVEIVLDTHPPVVAVEAERRIDAGGHWVVRLVADEIIWVASAVFADAIGEETAVGAEVSGQEVTLWVPTAGAAGGSGLLRVVVADLAGNTTPIEVPVTVVRPRVYSGTVLFDHAYEAELRFDHAYEATLLMEGDE